MAAAVAGAAFGPSICAASASSTGKRKMSVIDTLAAPSLSRISRCACTASSEWPPRAKKLSLAPDLRHAQNPRPDRRQIRRDRGGRSLESRTGLSGDRRRGSGQRLAVDLAVGRQRHRGQRARYARAPCGRAASAASAAAAQPRLRRARHIGHQPQSPGLSSRAITTAWPTPGWRSSAASISPSSIR